MANLLDYNGSKLQCLQVATVMKNVKGDLFCHAYILVTWDCKTQLVTLKVFICINQIYSFYMLILLHGQCVSQQVHLTNFLWRTTLTPGMFSRTLQRQYSFTRKLSSHKKQSSSLGHQKNTLCIRRDHYHLLATCLSQLSE